MSIWGDSSASSRRSAENLAEIAVSDWDLILEAVKTGKTEEALRLVQRARADSQSHTQNLVAFTEGIVTYLAGINEKHVPKALRDRYLPRMAKLLANNPGPLEVLQKCAAMQRGHQADLIFTEEPDRYILTYNPCGTGGRLKMTSSVGTTKKAYPWSWGKVGIPYYCTHCCVAWEIIGTELRGYPTRVNLVSEKPGDPCIHVFYKRPELIPDEYFTRIGMKKDPAKFK